MKNDQLTAEIEEATTCKKEVSEGAKKSKAGIIPGGWEKSEFEEYVTKRSEKFDPKKGSERPCIELEHINPETGSINGYVSSLNQASIKSSFKEGEVLFGKLRPYLRKFWLAQFKGACSSEIWVLTGREKKISNLFLFYFIQQDRFIQISNITSGTKMPRADWKFIAKYPFLLPPLPEQQKIAEILGTWDEAIQKCEQTIAALKTRNKGLAQQLLSGEKRLQGFEGEWKSVRINDIANPVNILNKEDMELEVLSCTKYDGLVRSLEYFGRKVFGDDLSKYKIVPEGCFAYATNHIEEGSIGYQNLLEKALISPMYTVFITTAEIDDGFMYRLLKTDRMIYAYQSNMSGSINRRGGLRWKDFSTIPIRIPGKQEQTAIDKVLSEADRELQLYQQKLTTLKDQKKGLMQKLLTGEVRVKTTED